MTALHPAQAKPQLLHHFVAGLRFDTVLEFLDAQGNWKPLCPEGQSDHQPEEWASAPPSQSMPRQLVEKVATILAGKVLRMPANTVSWQDWLKAVLPHCRMQDMDWALPETENTLFQALAAGGLMLVRLALPKEGERWMLVTGVECQDGGLQLLQLRALLVLDPAVSPVWACGHNARVSLPARKGGDIGALPHRLCVYRTLDGGWAASQVGRMIAIWPG